MKRIKYLFRVLMGGSFKRFKDVVDRTHAKCGKNRILIVLDMLWCFVRYGAGVHDYLIFAFYDMNGRQRNTYITRLRNKRMLEMVNDESKSYIFNRKDVFNKLYKDFLHRDFLCVEDMTPENFAEFMKDKDVIFAKPSTSESGKGIEKLKKADFASVDAMYEYIRQPEKDFGVLEQEIKQHHDLAALYPLSINTYRIVTLLVDGKAHYIYGVAKMGNEGKFVDNLENGGLGCPIDPKTGKMCGVAHTSPLINYDTHPYTGVKLVGYQLPYVREAIKLCLKAAHVTPEVGYVGWDVAVTEDGPILVEGNNYSGYDFWQLPEWTPNKRGLYPYFRKMIKGYK